MAGTTDGKTSAEPKHALWRLMQGGEIVCTVGKDRSSAVIRRADLGGSDAAVAAGRATLSFVGRKPEYIVGHWARALRHEQVGPSNPAPITAVGTSCADRGACAAIERVKSR